MIVLSSKQQGLRKLECPTCGETVLVSEQDKFCPSCSEILSSSSEGIVASAIPVIEANVEKKVVCKKCGAVLFASPEEDSDYVTGTMFCPKCGSADLEACDESEKSKEEDEKNKEKKEKQEEPEKKKEESLSDEETKKLTGIAGSFVSTTDPQWIFFNSENGNPLFRIKKSDVKGNIDLETIFESPKFMELVNQLVKQMGMQRVVAEIGGEVIGNEFSKVVNLESLAFERFKSDILPKFHKSLMLAVESGAKGIEPELVQPLKDALTQEGIARGLSEEEASQVATVALLSSAEELMSSLIRRASELLVKPDSVVKEIESLVLKAGVIEPAQKSTVSREDLDRAELRERLKQGSVPVKTEEPILGFSTFGKKKAVEEVRELLRFRRR